MVVPLKVVFRCGEQAQMAPAALACNDGDLADRSFRNNGKVRILLRMPGRAVPLVGLIHSGD
jgi:hypothetical protein